MCKSDALGVAREALEVGREGGRKELGESRRDGPLKKYRNGCLILVVVAW